MRSCGEWRKSSVSGCMLLTWAQAWQGPQGLKLIKKLAKLFLRMSQAQEGDNILLGVQVWVSMGEWPECERPATAAFSSSWMFSAWELLFHRDLLLSLASPSPSATHNRLQFAGNSRCPPPEVADIPLSPDFLDVCLCLYVCSFFTPFTSPPQGSRTKPLKDVLRPCFQKQIVITE